MTQCNSDASHSKIMPAFLEQTSGCGGPLQRHCLEILSELGEIQEQMAAMRASADATGKPAP